MTKKEFKATRHASERLVATEARFVRLKNTSADPGGLITGKSAAITSKKVSTVSALGAARYGSRLVETAFIAAGKMALISTAIASPATIVENETKQPNIAETTS